MLLFQCYVSTSDRRLKREQCAADEDRILLLLHRSFEANSLFTGRMARAPPPGALLQSGAIVF
jgi:hypothetical protein